MKKRAVKKRSKHKPVKKTPLKNKPFKKNPSVVSRKSFKINKIKKIKTLVPRASKSHREEFNFKDAYGESKLVLMARDPWWIYAYWEIPPKKEREVLALMSSQTSRGARRVLRVYRQDGAQEAVFFDVEVGAFADNWYVEVGAPGELWVSEIGLRTNDGHFYLLERSNHVRTPRYGVSDEIDPNWRLPETVWNSLFKVSGAFADSKSSYDLPTRSTEEKI